MFTPGTSRLNMPDSNKLNDWVEYKLLVLAELERLNDCIDKLQAHCNSSNTDINNIQRDIEETKKAIDQINIRMSEHHPSGAIGEGKWKFWAAVVTLVATAIASIISLVATMMSH